MRILYVGAKYDYGRPEQGLSFEHYNFYEFFRHSGHEIVYFDTLSQVQELGKDTMNRRLLEMAKDEHFDLMFTVLFTGELDPAAVRHISEHTGIVTLNWFCDDHWRFDNYSQYWAPSFNWVVTTAKSAVPKYAQLPYPHAIKSQWGCNHFLYRKLDLPLEYDVTFIGQPHGNRREIIKKIRKSGIKVQTFGQGWPAGRVSQETMIRIFNQSRINLNLSNASVSRDPVASLIKSPLSWLRARLRKSLPFAPQVNYFEQIKGRNFEVPGCGGFMLTGKAEDLENYYEPGKEVVCFENPEDLVEKIHYFLKHEDERAAIAKAGHERTLREHTYTHRFQDIFRQMSADLKAM